MRDLTIEVDDWAVPANVRSFLREAQRRIEQFSCENRFANFVPSDYRHVYLVLEQLTMSNVPAGNRFCEWGSGLGVVTCLASMVGFDAVGVEIEDRLVDAAQQLAEDFGLPVEFVRESFVPPCAERFLSDEDGWLLQSARATHEIAGFAPEDFDVVFVFSWPNEEEAVAQIFRAHADENAILMSYHGDGDLRLRQMDCL